MHCECRAFGRRNARTLPDPTPLKEICSSWARAIAIAKAVADLRHRKESCSNACMRLEEFDVGDLKLAVNNSREKAEATPQLHSPLLM